MEVTNQIIMFITFKLKILFFAFLALSIIIFASGPIQTVYSSEEEGQGLACEVEITGGESRMYPGQFALFQANLSEEQGTKNYTWTVEGPIIKDYDSNVDNGTLFNVSSGIEPPTVMSPLDFQQSNISFYWQPNATDMNRTVSVTVQTSDGKNCEDSRDFTVTISTDDINKQAEDFYVEQNHRKPTLVPGRTIPEVLIEHAFWHSRYSIGDTSYFDRGDLFFDFHNLFIKHFNEWRKIFGYSPIVAWSPGTPLDRGVDIDHRNRNPSYIPQPLPSWFQHYPGPENGPALRPASPVPCEAYEAPTPPWPPRQDELSDFPSDRELLGCVLTHPYHNTRHGAIGGNGGDMSNTGNAPRDPIFWRFHTFINETSENRTNIQELPPSLAAEEGAFLEGEAVDDIIPPRVFTQNPFRLYPFLTALPTISEQEKDLFGVAGVPAISAEFDEPVTGVTAKEFTVNGSPATQVYGKGSGPYIFIGFETPGIGPVNVTFAPGNITDEAGNRFEGTSWSYEIVEPTADSDIDGAMDGLEVNVLRTDPTIPDNDGDGISDGVEATSECLNPLVNDDNPTMSMFMLSPPINGSSDNNNNNNNTHGMIMDTSGNTSLSLDSDNDGIDNVQEIKNRTDPCSLEQPQQSLQVSEDLFLGADNATTTITPLITQNDSSTFPFAIVIQKSGGIAGSTAAATSILSYDSLSKVATSIVNGSKASRQISYFDEAVRILNGSGFLESTTTFYPPPSGSADYIEFTVIATLNGRVYAGYWTDVSEGVPESIRNLPYIMAYVIETGRVF
jgi:hypothetical protein